jgi:TolB-like protein/AraC-like DNA-binding protein
MPNSAVENDFLDQITALVEKNISSEQFGVSELADAMNMSRSNLLRKVKKLTNLSVSQLISQVRLERGMDLLRTSALNVSEVSHQVGFSSTSYFIKCFREYYGFPPGEVGKRSAEELSVLPEPVATSGNRKFYLIGSLALMAVLVLVYLGYQKWFSSGPSKLEKSIVVLPFKNDSGDSTNVYLINGLMESTLNNLQLIKDLRVLSRTSSEKYRTASKSIPEMAKELNANYFVEGSGQKIGDKIVLNIQLIDGSTDRHLWGKQYRRETRDIFALQQEIAKSIAEEIQAVITPEEAKRIEKIPTENLVAYDLFLKGRDQLIQHGPGAESISYFKQAIEQDKQFALPYAYTVINYYYLDIFMTDKKYTTEMGAYADKAMLLDPKSAESLAAKALYFMNKKEYDQAVPYFEKALDYNPNAGLVLHFLTELYNLYIPNTAKYMQYALQKVRVEMASEDSAGVSFNYLQLANALVQTGFIDESLHYMDKCLAYNPKNPFGYARIFMLFAKSRDIRQTKDLIVKELKKDTTRIDIVAQVAGMYYVMRAYDSANYYYNELNRIKLERKMDVFKNEDLRVADVLGRLGQKEKSEAYLKSFKEYADHDQSIYKSMHLAMYYGYLGDTRKAFDHMKLFLKEDNYQYWILLMPNEPSIDRIKDLPEFKSNMREIETKFWARHEQIKATLEEKGLL